MVFILLHCTLLCAFVVCHLICRSCVDYSCQAVALSLLITFARFCVSVFFLFLFVVSRSVLFSFFFFKQKTAYEMRISDWSSDVCSSDLGSRRCRSSHPNTIREDQPKWNRKA